MDKATLIHRLQLLQAQLHNLANDLGNLTDPEIIAVSEEADRLIVQLQRLQLVEQGRRKAEDLEEDAELLAGSQTTEEVCKKSRALILKHS